MAECPDSWENLDRMDAYETSNETNYDEEHQLVLFTQHKKGVTVKSGVNDGNYAVLAVLVAVQFVEKNR